MPDLEPIRYDSSGTPIYAHQVADDLDHAMQEKINSWFYNEYERYSIAVVKELGRHVI